MPTKDRGNDPAHGNKFNIQKDNGANINSAVDDIILTLNIKVSAGTESQEIIGSKFDKNDLYQIDNMILEDKRFFFK